jgi:hypothetical protein
MRYAAVTALVSPLIQPSGSRDSGGIEQQKFVTTFDEAGDGYRNNRSIAAARSMRIETATAGGS